jgi:hypothetical protein
VTLQTRTQSAWRLPAALLISVLLHLIAMALLLRGPAHDTHLDFAGILDRTDPEPTPLGLDRSRTVSVSWLGFETPTEHRAPRSAVEQSRLEVDPGRQGGAVSPRQIVQAAAAGAQMARDTAETAATTLEALLARTADAIRLAQRQTEQIEQIAAAPAPPPQPAPLTEVESPDSGVAGEGEGSESEKEADPTALTEPFQVQLGRTASGEGLEIFTQRPPRFTTLVQRTARPRNPLVDIRFKPDGTVDSARFRHGEGTGYTAVDEPLLDAIYGWRARGSRLEAVGEGETITVSIRILLN